MHAGQKECEALAIIGHIVDIIMEHSKQRVHIENKLQRQDIAGQNNLGSRC